jgi:hypothetical protein
MADIVSFEPYVRDPIRDPVSVSEKLQFKDCTPNERTDRKSNPKLSARRSCVTT